MTYFSEREQGERPREFEDISEVAWRGFQALISAGVEDGSFGATFPSACADGAGTVGTNTMDLWGLMHAQNPNLENQPWYNNGEELPDTLDILDLLQFCWQSIGKPIKRNYHKYFDHYHLDFDIDAGRDEFRRSINLIFRRNGLVYQLKYDGQIERLAPPVLREALAIVQFHTSDAELDRLLESARRKIVDPKLSTRREALEVLWDAWERLKTLDGNNKKAQVATLLEITAGESHPKLRKALEWEANELTRIGNHHQIRHSETDREPVSSTEHVDYLFHRLFALIMVILRSVGKGSNRR